MKASVLLHFHFYILYLSILELCNIFTALKYIYRYKVATLF
nr:MAG TPA: hypothetical protein [Caudoviricetes sp.]